MSKDVSPTNRDRFIELGIKIAALARWAACRRNNLQTKLKWVDPTLVQSRLRTRLDLSLLRFFSILQTHWRLNRANCLYPLSLYEKRNNFKVGKPGEIRRRKAIGPVKWQPVATYRSCNWLSGHHRSGSFCFTGGDNHELYHIKHPIDEDGFPPTWLR